jgi:hypothetical protein
MPSPRWLLALSLPLFLAGCDDRGLQQRAEQIRAFSSKEDRVFSADALAHIQRKYWTIRDHAWLGKLPDGTIVQLESPHATAAPLPSRAFYRGWHLQLTISAQDWRTDPPSPHEHPFEVVYAITRQSAAHWDIRVTGGGVTAPLRREDSARLQALTSLEPRL